MNKIIVGLLIAAALILAACTGEQSQASDEVGATAQASGAAPGSPITPDPGGKVITVKMETEADGTNSFQPAQVEAKRGDVIRYVLVAGVHNADFVADSNPGKSGLPPATGLLQLPGQAYDVKITLPPGVYYFHCDPHSLLGMKGQLTVTQ
jgi:plastocyanin